MLRIINTAALGISPVPLTTPRTLPWTLVIMLFTVVKLNLYCTLARVAHLVQAVQVSLQLVAGIDETIDVLGVVRVDVVARLDDEAEGAVEDGLVGWLMCVEGGEPEGVVAALQAMVSFLVGDTAA